MILFFPSTLNVDVCGRTRADVRCMTARSSAGCVRANGVRLLRTADGAPVEQDGVTQECLSSYFFISPPLRALARLSVDTQADAQRAR